MIIGNYISINSEYDIESILNLLDKSIITTDIEASQCTLPQRYQIKKIINIDHKIKSILYFKLNKLSSSVIHIDTNLDDTSTDSEFALNIPLKNCGNLYMNWFRQLEFDPIDKFIIPGPTNGARTPLLKSDNAICIDNILCNIPYIVKINDWHSVTNHSQNDMAMFISIRFAKDIIF